MGTESFHRRPSFTGSAASLPPPTSSPSAPSSAGRGRSTGSSRASLHGSSPPSYSPASSSQTSSASSAPRTASSFRYASSGESSGAQAASPSASPSATSASRWDTPSPSASAPAFGTLIPPIYDGSIHTILHETSGQIILAGILLCLIAVAINGAAGLSKEKEVTPEEKAEAGETDYNFGKGLAVAIFAGVMSSSSPLASKPEPPSAPSPKQNYSPTTASTSGRTYPVLIVVLWGGFLTNFVWSAILIIKNGSIKQFAGEPGLNPMRALSLFRQ